MKKIILLICLVLPLSTYAVTDLYTFNSTRKQQAFSHLTHELRCLVCQNQNLAESNAGLANDLRDQIYQKVRQGESEQAIIDYLTARYGDFILYQPPLNPMTITLWIGPFIFMLAGIFYLLYFIRKKQGTSS